MMTRFFKRWAEYPITHFFLTGIILGIFGKHPESFIECGFYVAALGGFVWYVIKAFLVTGNTIAGWKDTHPGEPMIHAGGLTEYDREFAKQVGRAARGKDIDDAKLTAYDRDKAKAIGKAVRG